MTISAKRIARSMLAMMSWSTNSWATTRTRRINRWLRDAMQQQIPVVYFLGTSPGRYQPVIPTFIVGWHAERLRVDLAFGVIVGAFAQAVPPDAPERRHALREIKAHRSEMPS